MLHNNRTVAVAELDGVADADAHKARRVACLGRLTLVMRAPYTGGRGAPHRRRAGQRRKALLAGADGVIEVAPLDYGQYLGQHGAILGNCIASSNLPPDD